MPIWLRKFTFSTLKEYYAKQNEEEDIQPTKGTPTVAPPDVVKKAIIPSYSTKASNK
jgi:hypothetical protein